MEAIPGGRPAKVAVQTVLLIDSDAAARSSLAAQLSAQGYAVQQAGSALAARTLLLACPPKLLLIDHALPDADAGSLLRELRADGLSAPAIALSHASDVESLATKLRGLTVQIVAKPPQLDVLLTSIEGLLRARERRTGTTAADATGVPDPLLARSEAMRRIKDLLKKVAQAPATVLLTGESGAGKDAAARYIHLNSERAARPFVNITCSALPDSLLESELFGHEQGAFTDARQRKVGLLEVAAGGTVFLDEIGEMTPVLQAKLLRFLEEGAFRRLGGTADIRPEVRIVAATNRNLREAVRMGAFREDLYYRLAVLHVHIPPLRERVDDIELLAGHFLRQQQRALSSPPRHISDAAWTKLKFHPWPGNVRELKNVIERAVMLTEGSEIGPDDLELHAEGDSPFVAAPREGALEDPLVALPRGGVRLEQLERDLLMQALERTRGNKTQAATLLGLTRDQIRYRIEKHGLMEVRRRQD